MTQSPDIRDLPFVLEFRLTGNADGDAGVVRLAGLLPGFAQADDAGPDDAGPDNIGPDGQGCRVCMTLAEAGIYRDVLLDLWQAVANTPKTALRLDGEPISPGGLKDALVVLDCAGACDASGRGAAYCTSVKDGWNWGCLHLRHVTPRPASEGGGPDREELKQRLRQAAKEKRLLLCPHFDQARTDALADALKAPPAPPPLPSLPPEASRDRAPGGPRRQEELPILRPQTSRLPPVRSIPATTYADVGGLDAAVRELRETIELPLRHPEVLQRLGIAHHRGALLYGPPGCGKTLLARAVACGSGAAFLPVSGPELITKWHGESEERLRAVFEEARERQPAIVFFDEIDAVAQSRSSDESLRLDSRFTTQLLTLMDGIHDLGRVFVLAATNRMDLLDKALLRPGRLDRLIEVPLPDTAGCLAILRIHARGLPLAGDVSLKALAGKLAGLTGADVAFFVREAAYACLRRTLDVEEVLKTQAPLSKDALQGLTVTAQDFAAALAATRARGAALESQRQTAGEGEAQ